MSGVGQLEDGVEASTSGMMETTMMEGEEYYNPDDSGTWTQKEMAEDQLCRICAKPNQYLIPIFEGEGIEHQLEPKIQKHLPIEVSETDDLPLQVCYQCASTLIAWNDLVIACIEADKKLRQIHEQEEDDKGVEIFDEPILDSDDGEEPDQPSTSIGTIVTDIPSDTTVHPKRSPGKAKKPKLKMTLVKSPTAGPSGLKGPVKKPTATKPQDIAVQEASERFAQTVGSFQHATSKYQQAKKTALYFVCDICFQPFKTKQGVLCHKREVHTHLYCTEKHLEMPVEVNIKEDNEVSTDVPADNDNKDSTTFPGMNIGGHIHDSKPYSQLSSSEDDDRSNSKSSFESASKGFRTKYNASQRGADESAENVESLVKLDPDLSSDGEIYKLKQDSRKINPKYPRLFPCDLCDKSFTRNYDMHQHRNQQHPEAIELVLQEGDSDLSGDEELYNFKKDSRKINPKFPRLFPCDLCGKSFTRNYDMHKHRKQQHPERTELVLEEDLNFLITPNNRKLHHSEHVLDTTEEEGAKLTIKRRVRKTYEKEEEDKISKARVVVDGVNFFHCDVCNHHLKSKYSFVTHLRIHSGEKPFTCHVCGRQFRVWEQLQRHVSDVHDKIKNYECHICGRKFATVNTRNEHIFTHSQDRSFVCHMCGKAFRSNGTLRVHYKFHTDIFPHQCPHCDKRFRMRQHFENHLRVHTGEKPHACAICGKHFRTKWCVKKHTLIHTSTETFECVVCRKHYSQKRYLRNHMRLSHGVRFTGNRMANS